MPVRPRGDGFQADFAFGGDRFRAHFPTRQQALQWEADARAALIAGRPLPVATTGANALMTMAGLQKATYEAYWKGSKNERGAVRNSEEFAAFVGLNAQPKSVDSRKIAEWRMELVRKGNSSATINRKFAAASKMMRYAVSLQLISAAPQFERGKEGKGRTRFLTENEAQALVNLLEHWNLKRDADFVAFLLDTGARLSEGLRIRPCDVTDTKVTLGALGSKNDEVRHIPLTARLRKLMPELIKGIGDRDPLFARLNTWTFRAHYRKAVEHLHLGDDVVVHTLRHTTASWMVQRGVDLRRVKEWMGHKSFAMTLRYAKLAPDDLQSALDRFDRQSTPEEAGENVVAMKKRA